MTNHSTRTTIKKLLVLLILVAGYFSFNLSAQNDAKPGEWNAPVVVTPGTLLPNGTYRTRPAVTILHNGVLVQLSYLSN